MVVPFSAGGPGDVIARLLGTSMSATLKQSIVIENVVGAGGTLGTNRVAKATPDGYTLLLMHVGQATAPALYAKLPFDPVGDFAPIGLVTDVPMILVARAELSRQGPEGAGRLRAQRRRQGHLWQCRPRLRVASVRTDVHERHREPSSRRSITRAAGRR